MATPTCSAADVAVGGIYTITGSGFTPAETLTVTVTDSQGTELLSAVPDAAGAWIAQAQAGVLGSYAVAVKPADQHGHKAPLATCSFQAV